MVLGSSCGDGPWLTWCLTDSQNGGGGCDPNMTDIKGNRCISINVAYTLEEIVL